MFKLNLKFISEDSVLVPYWMLRNHLLQSHLQVGNRTLIVLSAYCHCHIIIVIRPQSQQLSDAGPQPLYCGGGGLGAVETEPEVSSNNTTDTR